MQVPAIPGYPRAGTSIDRRIIGSGKNKCAKYVEQQLAGNFTKLTAKAVNVCDVAWIQVPMKSRIFAGSGPGHSVQTTYTDFDLFSSALNICNTGM